VRCYGAHGKGDGKCPPLTIEGVAVVLAMINAAREVRQQCERQLEAHLRSLPATGHARTVATELRTG